MQIEDNDQLKIDTNELVKDVENSLSVTTFSMKNAEDPIAYLFAMADETDASDTYGYMFDYYDEAGLPVEKENHNGLTYYLVCAESSNDAAENELVQSIHKAYEQAEFFAPVAPDIDTIDFKAFTLDGEEVGNDIFKDHDLTMINIWATSCNPCLMELPEMAAWEEELPDNVQIIYLDKEAGGIQNADKDMLEMIIKKTGINPDHVVMYENGLSNIVDTLGAATPTTFFVDANGNRVGDVVLGAQMDAYKAVVENFLENN